MSAGEVMRLTRMGRFSMDGSQSGPMALLKRLKGKKAGGPPTGAGARLGAPSAGARNHQAGNMIASPSGASAGIGFAIPVSLARNVMEQIIQNGSVTRGWIGVEVQAITAELAESFGMVSTEGTLISGVMRGSPAERAGVRPGDVLLAVEGRKVNDPQTMLEAIAALAPGRKAGFELRRGKEKLDLKVDIGRRPALSRGD